MITLITFGPLHQNAVLIRKMINFARPWRPEPVVGWCVNPFSHPVGGIPSRKRCKRPDNQKLAIVDKYILTNDVFGLS